MSEWHDVGTFDDNHDALIELNSSNAFNREKKEEEDLKQFVTNEMVKRL